MQLLERERAKLTIYLFQDSQDDGRCEESFICDRCMVVEHWDEIFETLVMISIMCECIIVTDMA
jgi:hypothetical protein